jgi:hypothetical protein
MGDRNETGSGGQAVPPARDAEADRRDSGRVRVALLVRDLALGGSFEPRDGNLSLGGVWFDALHPPAGTRVEVRFLLPRGGLEVHAIGEVLRVTRDGAHFGVHVKFLEIPLEAELAIARFLQVG